MNGLWSRVRDFVGFTDPVDGLEEYSEINHQDDYQTLYEGSHKRPGHGGSQAPSPLDLDDEIGGEFAGATASSSRERRRRTSEWAEGSGRDRRSTRERSLANNMGSNVIGLPTVNQVSSEVVVIEPRSFDEMAQVVTNLRERKSVIMNLTLMDPGDAQRSVDFVAGGTYAIDGHQERIGENIFLFTPSCVAVTTPSTAQPVVQQRPMQIPTPIWSASYADAVPAVGQR
jgi:cell division inhibitor SepF